jgi:dipeptidyl-peptidase-4
VNNLIEKAPYKSCNFTNALWSHNGQYILFTEDLRARDIKSGGNFLLYNDEREDLKKLTDSEEFQLNIRFSPDDEKIGFVRSNNLFFMDVKDNRERQLTFDGNEFVRNGHFDWVYEEEFEIIEGWRWSPDSKWIAFWQIDEQDVSQYSITEYDSLYLNWNHMRYPESGGANAGVRIGVVNINTGEIVWMDTGRDKDIYIPRIYWMPDSKRLIIIRLNRSQNMLEILLADIISGDTKIIFKETDARWLEITDDFTVVNEGEHFLWTSEKDGYRHIYMVQVKGDPVTQVTEGKWEVRSIVAVDDEKQYIYFTGAKKSPVENHLYRIDFNGKNLYQLTNRPGWHTINMSPDCNYYIDTYSGFSILPVIYICDADGRELMNLLKEASSALSEYKLAPVEFSAIRTEDGIDLNSWVIKPVDFSSKKKYPLLMFVYGGPASQTVVNKWHNFNLWHQYFAQNGYIVACVDNRGTGGKGAEFKKYVYKKLGHFEVIDQIAAVNYFTQSEYIDKKRIGIWGWSYGGYMSTLCLFKGNDVFKTAVAVAPVTSWRFYDTIYTERYMQTPKLNPDGYAKSAPLKYAKDLEGNYLIIHGTSDDNVHFQNTVVLVEELIRQNKQFQTMFYPGRYHSIRKKTTNTREHLLTLVSGFIFENL